MKTKFRVSICKPYKDGWNLGIGFYYRVKLVDVEETYLSINLFKLNISVGFMEE